ncbi:hypothetical protein [Ferrimonas sp. SCSIO 43195]|uniref:hypothetical protein n=1 Tax=Ferrimonas sp. SCSIO 43195 TaxID=2822844 RepID=UPI002075E1C4|nr:hypothetical protein [Ferrimonas sp. SCSIO 43195]USD39353.1 hypothetical protein J8Z22_09795 [Ferrimonas sp. SCSIO 43195]
MKRLWLLLTFSLWSVGGYAQVVLTHLPVNHFLGQQLTQNTQIDVRYLVPKRYGINRLTHWFSAKVSEQQARQWALEADAILNFASLWPSDPLYPLLRQYNIRLVAIDSGNPQHPKAATVALRYGADGQVSPYVWLNLSNLKTMVNNVGRDLASLYPEQAGQISINQQRLLKAIAKQERLNQDWLFDHEVEEVVVTGDKLSDFVFGNNLFQVGHISLPLDQWQDPQWQQLSNLYQPGMVLLLAKPPTSAATARLASMNVDWLLIDTIEKMGKGVSLQRWSLG